MSLRYKALIAVVLLVALLTGVLMLRSGDSFEQEARARIAGELAKDARFLNAQVKLAARNTRTALEGSAESSELVQLFSSAEIAELGLGQNLLHYAGEWRQDSDADVALAALDAFVAEDKRAQLIAPAGKDMHIVATATRTGAAPDKSLLADPELIGFMDRFYRVYLTAGKPQSLSQAAVLPVAGSVYLVVQSYLFESLQSRLVVGIGVVLTEINTQWITSNLPNENKDAQTNRVEKLVFSGDVLTASTLDDNETASEVFSHAISMDGTGEGAQFEVATDDETLLGLKLSSDLAPPNLVDRPGFITVKSLDRELAAFNTVRTDVFLFAGGLAILAAFAAYFGAYLVIRQLRRLQDATLKIRGGDFDTRVNIRGRDELAKLGKAFNDMTSGLKALGLYTHETLARSVLDNPALLGQSSAREEGSIFFSDIKGFTSIAEGMGAEAVTEQLNEYFGALGQSLRAQHGYVDKFIGDGIMAFWGPPFVKEGDYAERACTAALECIATGADLRARWQQQGKPQFFQRIGIATGEVVVGTIGTENKKNFTVIGDSVNLASRLEGANKVYGTEILVDERTAELARREVLFREIDQIVVVGKHEPVRIFEPVSLLKTGTQPVRKQLALYEKALTRYRAAEFEAAVLTLDELETLDPGDGPAHWLRARCHSLIANPPADGWEPVTTATSK
jgi:adenylate cyclase